MKYPETRVSFNNRSFFDFCYDHFDDFENNNINYDNIDVSKVDDISECFRCMELDDWSGIENLKFNNLKKANYAFAESNFNGDISKYNFVDLVEATGMFSDCESFTFKNSDSYNFKKVNDVSDMFKNTNIKDDCYNTIKNLINKSNVCYGVLKGCLISLNDNDISSFENYDSYYDICHN